MKLSVIVPVYNTSKYLEQCLSSIVNQTYKNLEILLINDGSTDNSLEICQKFAEADSRIRIFDIPNGGVSNARNVGLDNATGDYIAFVDSDDYLDLTMYEKLMTATINENTDGAVCYYYRDKDGQISQSKKHHYDLSFNKKQFAEYTVAYSTFGRINGYIWNMVVKKNCIQSIRFDTSLSLGEDVLFLLNIINSTGKFSCIDDSLYYYRVPTQNKNDSLASHPSILRHIASYEKEISFYEKLGLNHLSNAVYFNSFITIYTKLVIDKQKFKDLPEDIKTKLNGFNCKENYKAYMKGPSVSFPKKIHAFLVHHHMSFILRILVTIYKSLAK